MKTIALWAFAITCAAELFAARHIGLEGDAFNKVVPVASAKTTVFSPASFEVDCAIVAESLQTIPKANVSERMGVTVDFPSTYAPIVNAFECARTNGLKIVSARGFCVNDIRKARADHRRYLEDTYGAEVLRAHPKEGAESWFRTMMEGEMEDFSLNAGGLRAERYAFHDLICIEPAWLEPFPTENTREVKGVTCISDIRIADTWDTKAFTALRLPLKDGGWFYALAPKGATKLADLRELISSERIDTLLSVWNAVGDNAVSHGPCAIVMPRLELEARHNLLPLMRNFKVPTQGLDVIAANSSPKEYVQRIRFRLAENGSWEEPLVKKAAEDVVPLGPNVKRIFLTGQFVFFVYHEPTMTIPAAGQFVGQ